MGKLSGKVALVTGAASGIGYEIVKLYAQEGADVCINYHSRERAAKELKELVEKSYGIRAMIFKGDTSEEDQVKAMVQATVSELGKIDILVCSSGINTQVAVKDMTSEQWDQMIKVDLRSVFLCNRYVLPYMLEQKWGRIINISSQLGQIGCVNEAHYTAAKAGVIGFTKSLAREVAKDGVLANCIAPGPVSNPFYWDVVSQEWHNEKIKSLPLGRLGEEKAIAPTAVLLAADPDGNDYVGQTLGPNCGDVML